MRAGLAGRGMDRPPVIAFYCSYHALQTKSSVARAGYGALPKSIQKPHMPKLSFFYGITIKMYWDEVHHSLPHFHAYYAEYEASLDLRGEIIAGELPRGQLRLVQAWTELHAEELRADWELAVNEKQLNPIDPLR